MMRNVRYALRSLARTPGFTLTVLLTLAVAIGANSVVFSAIDTILLRPLPFPNADRLTYISHADDASSVDVAVPPIRLLDWRERNSTFEAIAAYYTEDVPDTTGDRPENVRRATVTPGFLDLWDIAPAVGRDFADAEHRFGGQFAALISDRYWRDRLNADPNALDNVLEIDGQAHAVIGIMPPSFAAVDRSVDLWTPHPVDAPWATFRQNGWFNGVVGRLRSGVTLDQGLGDIAVVQSQLADAYPETDDNLAVRAAPYKDTVVGSVRGSLWLLFGAVSVLLLIACTNIAALMLARATQRERDVTIRYSLGASRASVALHLATEMIVLVLAGTVAGLVAASGTLVVLTAFGSGLPRVDEVSIDERIFVYAIASAAVVVILCGLLPAVRAASGAGSSIHGGRTQVTPRHSLNWLLVGVQVALSVTLLAGAGLLLRSFDALARVDPGFDAAHVLTFRQSGSFGEAGNDYSSVVQRIDGTLEELTALPGIESAATSFALPGVTGRNQQELELVEGRVASESRIIAETRTVSPSYFETMQIPLLAGDPCRQTENAGTAENEGTEAVVNRSFAERYFSQRSVIGLHFAGDSPARITGIVGDARELGTNREPVPTVYFCFSAPNPFPWFFVRTSGEPMNVVATVRARLNELEPFRSVYDIAPLDRRIGDVYAETRLRTMLLTFFSAAALLLASLGLYGTLSYVVSLRRREVGLRMALGALSSNIVAQFLLKALTVVGVACLVGLALSFAFGRALTSMLYGVSPSDPTTLFAVILLVVGVATLAAILPAVRASRIDPMQALREE